jgi:hypothetical protein
LRQIREGGIVGVFDVLPMGEGEITGNQYQDGTEA